MDLPDAAKKNIKNKVLDGLVRRIKNECFYNAPLIVGRFGHEQVGLEADDIASHGCKAAIEYLSKQPSLIDPEKSSSLPPDSLARHLSIARFYSRQRMKSRVADFFRNKSRDAKYAALVQRTVENEMYSTSHSMTPEAVLLLKEEVQYRSERVARSQQKGISGSYNSGGDES